MVLVRKNKRKNKKGLFFTIDAILAVSILLGTLLVITSFYVGERSRVSVDYIANDVMNVLYELKVSEVDNPFVDELIANESITNMDNSILSQAGEFWAEGNIGLARLLIMNITNGLVDDNYGISLSIDGDVIFSRNVSDSGEIVKSYKIISGIEKNKTINGILSQSYLLSEPVKKSESFGYFGGFVGQGNITKIISDIPSDANITEMKLELNSGGNFNFYINGIQCLSDFVVNNDTSRSNTWDISVCNSSINNGVNNEFKISFIDDFSSAYIGGGYIKVKYYTDRSINNTQTSKEIYWFPGIEGILNLYSGADIPGTLNSWKMNLYLYNNYSSYVVVGNETVADIVGSSEVEHVYAERNNLSMSSGTIPIRVGISNISLVLVNVSGNPADVVLSTDVSGSMGWCGEYFNPYECNYYCFVGGSKSCEVSSVGECSGNVCGGYCWWPYGHSLSCERTKLNIAKEASKNFVDSMLNETGHRVGLNAYSSSLVSSLDLTDDNITLKNRIDSYNDNGGTCICCGINKARKMLTDDDSLKFIVVMSDGEANYYCSDFDDETGSSSGSSQASQAAIDAGEYACNNGIDVYSVGFGYDADHDTLKQVACSEDMYFNVSEFEFLPQVYEIIAGDIGIKANYSAQTLNYSGEVEVANLYPNSSIEFNYTPQVKPETFGEFEVYLETSDFSDCNPSFYVYDQVRVTDARLISFSSNYWTDMVKLNNETIWNLSKYGDDYEKLGDPAVIQLPPDKIISGAYNNLSIKTGEDSLTNEGCSQDNHLILFKGLVKAGEYTSNVLPKSEGCLWNIEFDDGSFGDIKIPLDYSGSKVCSFTSSLIDYDIDDAIDVAVYELLLHFDFDNDDTSNVNIKEMDLTIDSLIVPQVPTLWGPAVFEVQVW